MPRIPEGREQENGAQEAFEVIMARNFPNQRSKEIREHQVE